MKASDHISNLPKENATSIDSDVSLDVEKLQVSDDAMHHSFSTIFVEFFLSKAALLKLPTLMYALLWCIIIFWWFTGHGDSLWDAK